MKRNRHIGLLAFKWELIGTLSFIILFFLFGLIVDKLVLLVPNPITELQGSNEPPISHSLITLLIAKIHESGLYTILILWIILDLLDPFHELLVGFKLINIRLSKKIFSRDGIIFTFLLFYSVGYIGLYKIMYLQSKILEIYVAFWIVCIVVFLLQIIVPFILAEHIALLYRIKLKVNHNKIIHKMFKEGFGGSARWADVIQFEKKRTKFHRDPSEGGAKHTSSEIFLGQSLFIDDPTPRLVSVKNDVHMVTIGMSGSGKSTAVLMPNLALYDGNVYVYDPKGELAENTLRRRTSLQNIHNPQSNIVISEGKTSSHFKRGMGYALDPFNETNGKFGECRFNPLSEIDLSDENASATLNAIADGCVLNKREKEDHFPDWAKKLIKALIVHVLTKYPKKDHNLPFVLDLFSGQAELYYELPEESKLSAFKELLIDMMTNNAFGGICQQVAVRIMDMGDNERGSILSTTFRSLEWIGDEYMRKQLSETNIFTGETPHTVYYILSDKQIPNQFRWVRVIMNLCFAREQKISKFKQKRTRPLFIFDEFYQLGGDLEAVTKGFSILRGANIKLWLLVQNISQLQEVFGKTWTDIVSGSTVQTFGCNDDATAEWISKRLGKRQNVEVRKENKTKGIPKSEHRTIDPLLSTDEVENMLSKNNDEQIVFSPESKPMRLRQLTYMPINDYKELPPPYSLQGCFEDY